MCYINHGWRDKRLKRENHHLVILRDSSSIWIPDTYCLNCREAIAPSDKAMIKIDVEGYVYYSQL